MLLLFLNMEQEDQEALSLAPVSSQVVTVLAADVAAVNAFEAAAVIEAVSGVVD